MENLFTGFKCQEKKGNKMLIYKSSELDSSWTLNLLVKGLD